MTNLTGIKNIFFDLGGVLLNIDFKRTFDAFEALGIKDAHELNDRPEVLGLFMDLERGEIGKVRFLELFREMVLLPLGPGVRRDDGINDDDRSAVTDEQIILAFNALLLDFVPAHVELVRELRSEYRVFLLSNTNVIHAECYNARLKENFGIENLDHLMEKAFYSHDLGCRKPEREIYLRALELSGVKAEESLFIDDNQENVEAAEEVGMKSIAVNAEFTVLDIFG